MPEIYNLVAKSKAKVSQWQKQLNASYQDKTDSLTTFQKIFFGIFLILAVYFYGVYKTKLELLSRMTPAVVMTPTPMPQPSVVVSPNPSAQASAKPSANPARPSSTPKPISKPNTESSETISQKNAVAKAKAYLAYTAFSHDGLVAQLEYEKFSHEDAVYGTNKSGANWNEQAAKKAKQYMDYSAYSRNGLIDQLKYEKFTQEQAEYGASAVGL